MQNVLVVEDVDIAQVAAITTLESIGCKVDIAENGQSAILKALSNQYDAIFMDLGLPDIDVLTVTENIRQHSPNVQIFALTAHSDTNIEQQCIKAGMSKFLVKPLTPAMAKEVLSISI